MADFRAIAGTCEAILELLRNAYQPALFDDRQVDFQVYNGLNFSSPMTQGISLFLYRVFYNTSRRTPPGRLDENGRRSRTALPLDFHILLTAWGESPSLQHALLGWAMRTFEDTPIIPPGLLNARLPNVFRGDESVEIVLVDLSTEDLFRIWETVAESNYQISIPYVTRMVSIESNVELQGDAPVQQRTLDMGMVLENES